MKRVVITGGSRGIGKCIVEKLQLHHDITDFSRSSGVDLTKGIPDFECDILILNAGAWDNAFELNYEVPKKMLDLAPKGCLVILILSNAAYQNYGNDSYSTAKAGLLLKARRMQSQGYNIVTVSPGTVLDTNFWDNAEFDNRKKGGVPASVIADLVCSAISAYQGGGLITEMIVLPRKDNVCS